MSVENLANLLQTAGKYLRTHRLERYKPYEYQKKFHHAIGHETSKVANIRALLAGNKIGKTLCGGMETAMHATGQYPPWWQGLRYHKPITILCGSNTNEQTRDIVQAELFGDPANDGALGTGSVPIDCIGERTRKPGVPNAYDSVMVRHTTGGWSKILFRAYEQGAKKHMGSRIDFGWMDEEPPQDIYEQYIRGTFSTKGNLMITFTPEEGVTQVVHSFLYELAPGQALVRATWDDAPHMTPEVQKKFLAQLPVHVRDMRSKGIPLAGSGVIFPVPDDTLMVEPFSIPDYWPRLIGMDFGWDHPSALVWMAMDRDNDTAYIYNEWREANARIPVVAAAVTTHPDSWAPVAWPHDGMHTDKASGKPLAELYREHGLNMLPQPFSNPPTPGQREGQGGQGVEVGLFAMLEAMEAGRFKVFSTCAMWYQEKAIYHRKDNKVVKLHDDLISASRYAFQSLRHADVRPRQRTRAMPRGARLWQ